LTSTSVDWLIVSGFGIHIGGGRVLQEALLEAAGPAMAGIVIDQRFQPPQAVPAGAWVDRIAPSMSARLRSLNTLASRAYAGQVLLCFNGLPPFRRSAARTIAYIQSTHFIGGDRGMGYPAKVRVRLMLDRLLFRLGRRNLDAIWVQTPTVAAGMRRIAGDVPVHVVPFTAARYVRPAPVESVRRRASGHFLYPADGAPHKNHVALLHAWGLLDLPDARLELTLTDAEETRILAWAGLNGLPPGVVNHGRIAQAQVVERLAAGATLIFPSRTETFGLPLIEAASAGAMIVASELDYVRDVVVPDETFDPGSARSIARAIERSMGMAPSPVTIGNAEDVVSALARERGA